MTQWKTRLITLALLAVVGALSAHLVHRWLGSLRIDLTADDLYSLTDGTEALLEKMQEDGAEPVEVTLFFSETAGKTLPRFIKEFITYERYLRALLREYERESGGLVEAEFVDPVPDSDLAQEAADFGLDGKLINQEGDLFYFGLAFETETGSRDQIAFLWPNEQENVEYEISKTLYNLLYPERKKVGVISGLEVFGGAQDPFMAQMLAAQGRRPAEKWVVVELMEDLYEVEPIGDDVETISPDEYDLVVVIHPKDLPGRTVAALDEWIVRGGNALILVDPYAINDQAPQNPQQPWAQLQYKPSSNLPELFAAWGIQRPEDVFAADLGLAVRRAVSQRGPAESVVVDLLIDAQQIGDTTDQESPVVRGLGELRFLLAGELERVGSGAGAPAEDGADGDSEDDNGAAAGDGAAAGLEIRPLVTTTAEGSTLVVQPGFGGDGGLAFTDLNAPAMLRESYRPGSEPVVLAYSLRGRFPSAFPGGYEYLAEEPEPPPGLPPGVELPVPEDAERVARDPVPEEERGEAAVLVFADVDFIADQLAFVQSPFGILQAANDNHRLFLNSVDVLLGSRELMAIRGRKTLQRPFVLFDEIEAQAELDTLEREQQIRAEIERFQDELRDKQSGITARNASLFEKRVQDEVAELNRRLEEANAELREIRRERRVALERQESLVRFSVMGLMPLLILIFGVWRAVRRRTA